MLSVSIQRYVHGKYGQVVLEMSPLFKLKLSAMSINVEKTLGVDVAVLDGLQNSLVIKF